MRGATVFGEAFEGVSVVVAFEVGSYVHDRQREFESFGLVDGDDAEPIAGESFHQFFVDFDGA